MRIIKHFTVILFVSLFSFLTSAHAAEVKPQTFVAVEQGDVNLLKTLIQSGANVNEVYEGVSLLNKACGGGLKVDNNIVKLLLESPKINVKAITLTEPDLDKTWATTPLIALISSASLNSKVENVVKMIKMGVDVNYHSSYNTGGTALWISTFGSQTEDSKAVTMAILKNAGPNLNVNFVGGYNLTALRNAVQAQHAEAVEAMLKRGAKVEDVKQSETLPGLIPETIDHDNFAILDILMKYGAKKYGPVPESFLPLNMAMIKPGDVKWAEYFITKYKVDVNYPGKPGTSSDEPALNTAAFYNNVEGLKLLLRLGAKINQTTSQGISAIQMAAQRNSLDAAKYLISQKANLKGYNTLYFNAITYAVAGFHTDMIELLVKSGADINEVSKGSPWGGPLAKLATSFSPADKKARLNTLNKLLELGADPNVLHYQNMTAVMLASKLGTSEGWKAAIDFCDVMIKKGADINLKNTSGETALMLACQAANVKLVELLIKNGADVNAVNRVGETALNYINGSNSIKANITKALNAAGAKPATAGSATSSTAITVGTTDSKGSTTSTVVGSATTSTTAGATSKSVPANLVGTWKGYTTNDKTMLATFIVNKDNTYSYSAVGKVSGQDISINHKGQILASEDTYTLIPLGQPRATYSYKITANKLVVNNTVSLNKVK